MRKIESIIVHCSDSPWGDAAIIREWHLARNWNDIGYHAIVLNGHRRNSTDYDEICDGLIEMGRPLEKAGSHCYGNNKCSIGICLVGVEAFTPPQFYSLRQMIDVWRQLYNVPADMIGGHKDFQMRHAGKRKTCPNFDVGKWMFEAVAV